MAVIVHRRDGGGLNWGIRWKNRRFGENLHKYHIK
jgi:hypothetical protein